MAWGIVEVVAKGGYDVTLVARSDAKAAGVAAVHQALARQGGVRGRLEGTAAVEVSLGSGDDPLDDFSSADLVIEAIAEDLEVKLALFETWTISASPARSLPPRPRRWIIECAEATDRPADVIGMHFFNPAPVMKLVEVVCTVVTPRRRRDRTCPVRHGRQGRVSCGDRAGFIVNALLFPYLNDAIRMHEARRRRRDIDTAMKEGYALPMGPFELIDVVGNDVSLAIQRELYLEFREPGFAPGPAAGAPRHGRLPRSQDQARLPGLQQPLTRPRTGLSAAAARVGP